MDENLTKVKIGKGIAAWRIKKGLSQDKLGQLVNTDRYQISRLELGKRNIKAIPLFEIIEALDITLSEFFKSIDM